MRTFNVFMVSVLILSNIVMLSCTNQDLDIEPQKSSETRAIVNPTLGTSSKSNPNLYNDWENITTIYLNGGKTVNAPWVIQGGNTMNIPDNVRIDIKKENGWSMLGHTITESTSAEPNYMIFYHKKTGILKGFYFSDTQKENENFNWILEADKPSSIIPSNTKEANLTNSPVQYSSTSNILKSSVTSSSGALRYGWNCFTFELPYGQIHTNPIVHIDGYNILVSNAKLNGTFAGEVVVPSVSSSNSLDPWVKYWGTVSNLSSAISSFDKLINPPSKENSSKENHIEQRSALGVIGIVSTAVSVVSGLLGAASSFTSKNQTVINRYKLGGDIELTGSIISNLRPNLAISLNNIDIKALNNNEELGVWGLKESPKIRLEKYGVALAQAPRTRSESNAYTRIVNLTPTISKDAVIINPKLRPLIKNYTVSTKCIFSTKEKSNQLKLIPSNLYKQIAEHWYTVEITSPRIEITKHLNPDNFYLPPGKKEHTFYLEYMDRFPETYIDVTVTIEYTDGEIFSSGRVFKIDGTVQDNKQEILKSQSKTSFNPVFL